MAAETKLESLQSENAVLLRDLHDKTRQSEENQKQCVEWQKKFRSLDSDHIKTVRITVHIGEHSYLGNFVLKSGFHQFLKSLFLSSFFFHFSKRKHRKLLPNF